MKGPGFESRSKDTSLTIFSLYHSFLRSIPFAKVKVRIMAITTGSHLGKLKEGWTCFVFITWLLKAVSSSALRCTAKFDLTTDALSSRSSGPRLICVGCLLNNALWHWPLSCTLTTNTTSYKRSINHQDMNQ